MKYQLLFLAFFIASACAAVNRTDTYAASNRTGVFKAKLEKLNTRFQDVAKNLGPAKVKIHRHMKLPTRYQIIKLEDKFPKTPHAIKEFEDLVKTVAEIRTKISSVMRGYVVKPKSGITMDELRKKLAKVKFIDIVEDAPRKRFLDETPWGLDRMDQPNLPLDGKFTSSPTKDVTIVFLDSGINADHPEFEGRAKLVYSVTNNTKDAVGHGTATASCAAGKRMGVAKDAKIQMLKVSDTSPDFAEFAKSLEFLFKNLPPKPAVINLSLGGGTDSDYEHRMYKSLVEKGYPVFLAAGNSAADFCWRLGDNIPGVMYIGSTTKNDSVATFSNFGNCVKFYAPGSKVNVATNDNGYSLKSGTSFSAPYAAGIAAQFLQRNPNMTPAELEAMMLKNSVNGILTNVTEFSNNRLIQSFQSNASTSRKLLNTTSKSTNLDQVVDELFKKLDSKSKN